MALYIISKNIIEISVVKINIIIYKIKEKNSICHKKNNFFILFIRILGVI